MKRNIVPIHFGKLHMAYIWMCGNCGAKITYTTKVMKPEYRCECGYHLWLPINRQMHVKSYDYM